MNKKPFFYLDERNRLIAYRIIAVMYFLTITAMQGVTLYRQFVLGQAISDFEDFAIILTVNSLFLITALLYFGAIPLQKIRVKYILFFYLLIVVFGGLFTYAKYNIFQDSQLSFAQQVDKILIVFTISGLIVLFFVIFSILGKRKLDKKLADTD